MRQNVLFGDVVQGTGVGDEGEWKIGGSDILRVCYCIDLLRSLVKGSQKAPSRVLSRVVYTGHKRKKCYLLSAFPIFLQIALLGVYFLMLLTAHSCMLIGPSCTASHTVPVQPPWKETSAQQFLPEDGTVGRKWVKSILNCSPWLDLNESHSWEAQRWHWGWVQY